LKPYIEINPEICKGCGLCMQACPVDDIGYSGKFNSHGYDFAIPLAVKCIGCGMCFYACPELNAVKVFREDADSDKEKS